MFGLCGHWDLRRMLSAPLVNRFGFFNVELLVHGILFVFLWLLLTGSFTNICGGVGGDLGAGPEGDEYNMAKDGYWADSRDIQFRNQHALIQLCKSGPDHGIG